MKSIDLVCRVIDNFGDAGIAIRLSRQLVAEHGEKVTLWIDDLKTLSRLAPSVEPALAIQNTDGVEIRLMNVDTEVPRRAGREGLYWTDAIIDLFGADLPTQWIEDLERRFPYGARNSIKPPKIIVFEYLTAESFAEDLHGKNSPPPNYDAPRVFFFPGWTEKTGGILREKNLFQRRDAFLKSLERDRVVSAVDTAHSALQVSLFCYDTERVVPLLNAFSKMSTPLGLRVPENVARNAIAKWKQDGGAENQNFKILSIPFTDQARYDELLWRCDVNFVRGEDSLTRALWAGKPFIWEAYIQEESAHFKKVAAFLDTYSANGGAMASAFAEVERWWNGMSEEFPSIAFRELFEHLDEWKRFAKQRCDYFGRQTDLAERLAKFWE